MDLEELNELDLSEVAEWPLVVRSILLLLICVGVIAGGYFLDIEDQYIALEQSVKEEKRLKADFEIKQGRSANLESYKLQLIEMEESFGAMLGQLPDKTEVADLLVDVSQTGLAAGLEFELFEPQAEEPKEFYAELPIKIRVIGSYHEFGQFISGLAALPRIVTIHNIEIEPVDGGEKLALQATAKTYRYLEEE